MAKEQENTMNYSIHDDRVIGEVQISVVAVAFIAGLAATEVKGVASMYGNITNELVAKLGMKNLSKGVKIEVADGKVSVELAINLEYGYNIPEVTGAVQDRVKSAIETMTGLSVEGVNIRVAGVNLEDE